MESSTPKKRNSMSGNWARDNCVNHVADRVAGGPKDFDIDYQYHYIQLQADDIMESLVLPNNWTLNMKDGSTPILDGLQQQTENWRLATYLKRRDEHRAELIIPRPPRWADTTPALAAQIYDAPVSSLLLHPTASNSYGTNTGIWATQPKELNQLIKVKKNRFSTTPDQGMPS